MKYGICWQFCQFSFLCIFLKIWKRSLGVWFTWPFFGPCLLFWWVRQRGTIKTEIVERAGGQRPLGVIKPVAKSQGTSLMCAACLLPDELLRRPNTSVSRAPKNPAVSLQRGFIWWNGSGLMPRRQNRRSRFSTLFYRDPIAPLRPPT